MHLLLPLLLPLLPVLISASEPNKEPTLLNRQNGGCDILEIFTNDSGLIPCGTPGWDIEPDCTCCGGVTACVNSIQTCGTADGVFVCYGYGAYPTPSQAAPSSNPAGPSNDPTISISSLAAPSSSPTASIGAGDNSAQSFPSTAASAASPTSSDGPSLGPPGKSAASMGLQRANVIKVAFVAGLLLVFGGFL